MLTSYVLLSHRGDWYADSPNLFFDKAWGWYSEHITMINMIVVPLLVILVSLLMISKFRYASMKYYALKIRTSFKVLLLSIVILLLVYVEPEWTTFLAMMVYMLYFPLKSVFFTGKDMAKEKYRAR